PCKVASALVALRDLLCLAARHRQDEYLRLLVDAVRGEGDVRAVRRPPRRRVGPLSGCQLHRLAAVQRDVPEGRAVLVAFLVDRQDLGHNAGTVRRHLWLPDERPGIEVLDLQWPADALDDLRTGFRRLRPFPVRLERIEELLLVLDRK